MTVSEIYEDGSARNRKRPYAFNVRAGDRVTVHRYRHRADAATARQEFVDAEAADDAGYSVDVLRAKAEGYEWS